MHRKFKKISDENKISLSILNKIQNEILLKGKAARRVCFTLIKKTDTLLREHGSASRDLLDSVLSANGMTITPVIESASNQALIACAEHNIGVAVLPQKLVAEPIKKNRLKVIEVDDNSFERCYYIVHHKKKI